jgi:DNA-binding response OmpR family regulator
MTKILAIEDDDNIRDIIVETLTLEKFEVMTANNGRQGVELAKTYLPDLIICDVMMPELDGYGTIAELNQSPETQGIPFIFLTGKNTMDDFRHGMNLGANDYLTKPFTSEELVTAVKVRLQRYRLA